MSESGETEKKAAEPLSDKERKLLSDISERIREAALNNDHETASYLRRQLIDSAGLSIIDTGDVRDAALPPMFRVSKKKKVSQ